MKRSNSMGVMGVAFVLITLGLVLWFLNTIAIVPTYAVISWLVSIPLVLLIVLGTLVLAGFTALNSPSGGAFILVLGGIAAFIALLFQPYLNAHHLYNASHVGQKANAAELSYNERVPYDVALAVSKRSLGDTTGDASGYIRSIPEQDSFSTLINRRGFLTGYESTQMMNLPLFGGTTISRDISTCDFSESASLRLDGILPHQNMAMHAYRQVSAINPTISINTGDTFAICEDDTPKIYMPATKAKLGWVASYRVPAGVVVYNGKTGELTHHENMENANLPVYPSHLAVDQRNALNAAGSPWDYMFNTVGYETTAKDEEDVNGSNSTEFSMVSTEGDSSYVTPLTPRGESVSVVDLSHINSEEVTSGSLNSLTVSKYDPPRDAPSTVAASIISEELSGYRANGLTVFEVVPSKDGNWTASIGRDQNILYRALIDADGEVTLIDAKGKSIESDAPESNPTESPENSEAHPADSPEPSVTMGKPLDQMSVEELRELADSITGELADRASAAEAPAE